MKALRDQSYRASLPNGHQTRELINTDRASWKTRLPVLNESLRSRREFGNELGRSLAEAARLNSNSNCIEVSGD
jgi:hypothetical protein